MNQTCLLALFLSVCTIASAQTVTLPYNPDANQDSVIGAPDLLEFLPYFGGPFTPGEVLIDGENLTEYIAFLEAAAENATSDTITIPMMPGTNPGQMLYWNGEQWSLVPVGPSGSGLILDGSTPVWMDLKTGCRDVNFAEYDPEATVSDGSCETPAIPGCMDSESCNFNALANVDDGTCDYSTCAGCMDAEACNWDNGALIDDGTCDYSCLPCGIPSACNYDGPSGSTEPSACDLPQIDGEDCDGNCLEGWFLGENGCVLDSTFCTGGIFDAILETHPEAWYTYFNFEAYGQLDSLHVTSFWPSGYGPSYPGDMAIQITDPFSRTVVITSAGYSDPFGNNPDFEVTWPLEWYSTEPGEYSFGLGMLPEFGGNGNWQLITWNTWTGDVGYTLDVDLVGLCVIGPTPGCTDSDYVEYNSEANSDDGSCTTLVVEGCMDSAYLEYDASANTDDGSCATLAPSCVEVEMDGYTYEVVEIGDQCWFAENLRSTTYSNGDLIPAGLPDNEWMSSTTGATAVYGEIGSTCYNFSPDIDACDNAQSLAEYGRLYNWYAVDDWRGLCPVGWHVPTDEEWSTLKLVIQSQGFGGTEGVALKSTTGWFDNNGTDDFGFSAYPAGRRWVNGTYDDAGYEGLWWSSTPYFGGAWCWKLSFTAPDFFRVSWDSGNGFSVRCLKDAE